MTGMEEKFGETLYDCLVLMIGLLDACMYVFDFSPTVVDYESSAASCGRSLRIQGYSS
jgi:hypothetical protein